MLCRNVCDPNSGETVHGLCRNPSWHEIRRRHPAQSLRIELSAPLEASWQVIAFRKVARSNAPAMSGMWQLGSLLELRWWEI